MTAVVTARPVLRRFNKLTTAGEINEVERKKNLDCLCAAPLTNVCGFPALVLAKECC